MSFAEIVTQPADLTREWLERALGLGERDVRLRDFRSEPVGTGQMAHNERIFLVYEDEAAARAAGLPGTVVAKLPSPSEESRNAGAAGGYRTETLFYLELADQLPCVTPKCHFGAIAEDAKTFTLLLEDLAPKRQGDQIAGATNDEIEAAVRNLAGLHAPLRGSERFADYDFLIGGTGDQLPLFVQAGAPAFVERYADRLSAEDVETIEAFAANVQHWKDRRPGPPTLVHQDYRLDNLMFERAASGVRVAAVDWQTLSVGCGGQDLAYLLGNSCPPEQRRASEERMLAAYRDAMAKLGAPLDDAAVRAEYAYGAFQGPTITMLGSLAVGQTARGDDMFMAMISRSCAQIRDLGSLELIS